MAYYLFKSLIKDYVPHAINLKWNKRVIPSLYKILVTNGSFI